MSVTRAPLNREASHVLGGNEAVRVLLVQHACNVSGSTISGHLAAQGMRNAGWEVEVAFGYDGEFRRPYDLLGCSTYIIPHRNWLRSADWLRSLKCLVEEWRNASRFELLMEQVCPDVVYINSVVSLAAAIAAARRRIPCVWHIRELFADVGGEMQIPAIAGRWLVRNVIRRLSCRQVAISHEVISNVLGLDAGCDVRIVPNAVADDFFESTVTGFEARRQLGLPQNVQIVGVPGTLRPVKGHEFFLRAAAHLGGEGSDVHFAIVGDGEPDYVDRLKKLALQVGVADQISWLGTVNDMSTYYRACDIVCVPSRSESFGRTVIESFASGVPVVATNVGGMRDTIDDGQTGLLVEYGDCDGLVNRLKALLADRLMRENLVNHARYEATEHYSQSQYQTEVVQIVTEALERM